MRILVATHQYHPAIGGAERYITDLTVELVARGHRIQVLTSRSTDSRTWRTANSRDTRSDRNEHARAEQSGDSPLAMHTVHHGVAVRRFRALRRGPITWRLLDFGLRSYLATRKPIYQPFIFLGNGPVLPALFPYIVRNAAHFDLLHINHLHYAHAWPAARAAALCGLPVVTTPHLHIDQPETYDIAYMRRILQHSQVTIAQTAPERDQLVQMGIDNVVIGGNGLRLREFPPLDRTASRSLFQIPDDAFVVLFLGRKVAYKGLQSCLQAFSAFHQQHPNAYLLAIGPETPESEQMLAPYRNLPNIVIHDAVPDVKRLAALAACDVLAVPSTGEAFGIIYLEAWAYAKPVIGANIKAVAGLIEEGEDGYLVDQAQPHQLLSCLVRLAEQPALAGQMGENGHAKLHRRYSMATIADIVEGAYLRILRRQATSWPRLRKSHR